MVEKIQTIRRVTEVARLALVINVRTDVYLHAIGAPVSRFDHAVELTRLSVAWVSLGPGPMRATPSLVRRMTTELVAHGTSNGFRESLLFRAECNGLFEKA
jgi:2-methylisocitrate lyase-like PEP mutase family enzyme